tara:strand:- start:12847 stop:13320 length:474 start_codon:yes stop_codon:yes gene_type:complete
MLKEVSGCVYCGAVATSSDHLEPLVVNGVPSGLVATVLDMLPCCAWCNSSKGQRHWTTHMDRLVVKQRQAEDHDFRKCWISTYDKWRNTHAQRWDVNANMSHIRRLNAMVDDAHAFMQQQINLAVKRMHGSRAIVVHDRGTHLDWTTIVNQLLEYSA